jgi:hypothetical protein
VIRRLIVVGGLLGHNDGRRVEITDSFEFVATVDNNVIVLDPEFYQIRLGQGSVDRFAMLMIDIVNLCSMDSLLTSLATEVHKGCDMVGWYACGLPVSGMHLALQRQVSLSAQQTQPMIRLVSSSPSN